MRRSRLLLLAGLAALAAALLWYLYSARHAPPGQPPLARLDAGALEALRADFNRDADQVRIVVLLSPT